MLTQNTLNDIIEKFCRAVTSEIKLTAVYLFGSYAKGNYSDDSDIDLAVVSDEFQGIRFDDNKRLQKYFLPISPYIETHPFKTKDFTPDNPFVREILTTGIKII